MGNLSSWLLLDLLPLVFCRIIRICSGADLCVDLVCLFILIAMFSFHSRKFSLSFVLSESPLGWREIHLPHALVLLFLPIFYLCLLSLYILGHFLHSLRSQTFPIISYLNCSLNFWRDALKCMDEIVVVFYMARLRQPSCQTGGRAQLPAILHFQPRKNPPSEAIWYFITQECDSILATSWSFIEWESSQQFLLCHGL